MMPSAAVTALVLTAFAGVGLRVADPPHPPGRDPAPSWLRRHMETLVGRWITDNTAYRGADEPADEYGLEWEWGIGRHTVTGRLFSLQGGKETATHWQFRVFWHAAEGHAVVQQFGANGVFGVGTLRAAPNDTNATELDQTFYGPDGTGRRVRHVQVATPEELRTASFDWVDGAWQPRRTYVWRRAPRSR